MREKRVPELEQRGGTPRSKLDFLRLLVARLVGRRPLRRADGDTRIPAGVQSSLLAQLTVIEDIRARLDEMQTGIERHAAQSLQREQVLRQRYDRLVGGLFLLLDYFEEAERARRTNEEMAWFHCKIRRILEDDGIEEIEVQLGEQFHGEYHRRAGERPDESPRGSVIEVTRKGYRRTIRNEKIVLRPAEVVLSSGPAASAGGPPEREVQ